MERGFRGWRGRQRGAHLPVPQVQPPDSPPVRVRLLWDVLAPEPDSCPPLYVLWRLHSESWGGGEGGNRSGGAALTPPLCSCVPVVCGPPPGNVPTRLRSWRAHGHPFSLAFLEAVLSHVGLSEVHKAIALFLETLAAPGGPWHLQR